MSKFIAFVAALLVSTLSFAQQFITFTKEKVEPREGLAISVPDTLSFKMTWINEDERLWSKVDSVVKFTAVVDLNMTIGEVLKQGYILNIKGGNNAELVEIPDPNFTISDFWLAHNETSNFVGLIDFVGSSDTDYFDSYGKTVREGIEAQLEHKIASCLIIKS